MELLFADSLLWILMFVGHLDLLFHKLLFVCFPIGCLLSLFEISYCESAPFSFNTCWLFGISGYREVLFFTYWTNFSLSGLQGFQSWLNTACVILYIELLKFSCVFIHLFYLHYTRNYFWVFIGKCASAVYFKKIICFGVFCLFLHMGELGGGCPASRRAQSHSGLLEPLENCSRKSLECSGKNVKTPWRRILWLALWQKYSWESYYPYLTALSPLVLPIEE